MTHRAVALLVASVVAGGPATVRAESEQPPEVSGGRRALAVGAAFVPGALLHGSGHWVIGERRTARRLLALEGVGLGLMALGAAPLGLSGAARDVSGPAITSLVAGGTLFLAGMLADAYGASGLSRYTGRAARRAPDLELALGYAYVDDPQFRYGSFVVVAAEARWREARLTPTAWLALDDDNQRVTADGAYRLLSGAGGSRLEAVLGVTHHRDGTEDFATTGFEVSAAGRLDLARIGPSLGGAFSSLMLGAGTERIRYTNVAGSADWNSQLIGRAALGVYLGQGRGEASVFYDHRRDDYAGGLALERGGGFIGYFGANLRYRVFGAWSVLAAVERGSANIARVGVAHSFGGVR